MVTVTDMTVLAPHDRLSSTTTISMPEDVVDADPDVFLDAIALEARRMAKSIMFKRLALIEVEEEQEED